MHDVALLHCQFQAHFSSLHFSEGFSRHLRPLLHDAVYTNNCGVVLESSSKLFSAYVVRVVPLIEDNYVRCTSWTFVTFFYFMYLWCPVTYGFHIIFFQMLQNFSEQLLHGSESQIMIRTLSRKVSDRFVCRRDLLIV